VPRVTRASIKKIPVTRNLKCLKKSKETEVSLEAHASTISPADVSNFCLTCSLCILLCSYTPFFSGIIEEIRCLGH
jgi:hypothetical protein